MRRSRTRSPPCRKIDEFLAARRPDALLASPVIEFASSQVEYLKARGRSASPPASAVASWDNLTGKGLLRFVPDRVFVWNEVQRQSSRRCTGSRHDRVVLTGAQRFDDWFERRPTRPRADFAAEGRPRSGEALRPVPLLLPVHRTGRGRASSAAGLAAVRAAESPASQVGLLVRPHPQNGRPVGGRLRWPTRQLGRLAAARRAARRGRGPRGLLRLARTQRVHRRDQHQRPDRGGDRRQGVLTVTRPRLRRHAGRDAALPLPALGERRAAPRRGTTSPSTCPARAALAAGAGGLPPRPRTSSSASRGRAGSTSRRHRSSRRDRGARRLGPLPREHTGAARSRSPRGAVPGRADDDGGLVPPRGVAPCPEVRARGAA